ncbi:ubiquitin carboxyl-terminal hydrolase 4-like [Mercenaria mercenaria]|uniref:ubiquitin carboxyl-terminal hydrolase 4-like n=1 Tax=Mercenaria mercenaria TaxID=6596 RepID=UPI00234ECC73|nr:ubiquitin carboxyl-terminal hydrolase 4-like [Mercenaria mercenaria]
MSRFVYVPGDDESQDIHRKSQNGNIAGSESLQKIFQFSVVNSYRTAEMAHKLNDDGNHLKLSSEMYIAANWSDGAKKEFYNDSEAESFEILIVTKETTNIEQLLEQFTATEDLEESLARYCEKCKKKLPVAKKLTYCLYQTHW